MGYRAGSAVMKGKNLFLAIALLAVIAFASSDFSRMMNRSESRSNGERANLKTERPVIKRNFNPERIANGERLYLELCFMCHGMEGEGDPGWKTPGEDGKYTAPPLNGTGHAWHHPMKVLHDYTKYGSVEKGGAMTGFEGVLSDEDITDIILWFQSKWPGELYDSWYQRDLRSKKN